MFTESLLKPLHKEEKLDLSDLSDTDLSNKIPSQDYSSFQGVAEIEIKLQELDFEIRDYSFPYYIALITVLVFAVLGELALIAWIIVFQKNINIDEGADYKNHGIIEMEIMMRDVGIILLILTTMGLATQMVGIRAYKRRIMKCEVCFIYMVFIQIIFEIAMIFFSAVHFFEMFFLLPFTILQLSLNLYQIMSAIRLLGLFKEHELLNSMKISKFAC